MTRAGKPPEDAPRGTTPDAYEAVRRQSRVNLPRRFYTDVASGAAGSGFGVHLDGRPALTPKRAALVLPTKAMAEAVGAEWQAQGPGIDPATMPLTKLANTAIDGVANARAAVIGSISAYVLSDLTCYRSAAPRGLAMAQAAHWDPVLAFTYTEFGLDLNLGTGVMPIAQPADAGELIARELAPHDPFALASLHVMTTLTGSVLIALAHVKGRLTLAQAWVAAHVDEDWQISQWGEDAEANARRAKRHAEMLAASRMFALGREV